MQRQERFDRLEAALDQLPPDYREVILLTQIRGFPIGDVATRMGRSRDAISMLLLRALRRLKLVFGTTDSLRLPDKSLDRQSGTATPPGGSPPEPRGAG
jgi:DNA-directed RNA polymerase specialized sigma24 family protein